MYRQNIYLIQNAIFRVLKLLFRLIKVIQCALNMTQFVLHVNLQLHIVCLVMHLNTFTITVVTVNAHLQHLFLAIHVKTAYQFASPALMQLHALIVNLDI